MSFLVLRSLSPCISVAGVPQSSHSHYVSVRCALLWCILSLPLLQEWHLSSSSSRFCLQPPHCYLFHDIKPLLLMLLLLRLHSILDLIHLYIHEPCKGYDCTRYI